MSGRRMGPRGPSSFSWSKCTTRRKSSLGPNLRKCTPTRWARASYPRRMPSWLTQGKPKSRGWHAPCLSGPKKAQGLGMRRRRQPGRADPLGRIDSALGADGRRAAALVVWPRRARGVAHPLRTSLLEIRMAWRWLQCREHTKEACCTESSWCRMSGPRGATAPGEKDADDSYRSGG